MPEMDGYDVIVVGSGAAGGSAARELAEQGLSVLVLEAGRAVGPQDMLGASGRKPAGVDFLGRVKAMLFGQPIQARVAFFNPRMVSFLVKDWVHRYRTAGKAAYLWFRGRQVGGRLHIFGRVLLRWSDADFCAHSGSADTAWPLRYHDLAPYYEKIERLLEVQGNKAGIATMPDGATSGPGLLTRSERAFKAFLDRHWLGRGVTTWRFAPPDTTPEPRALADALASGRVELRSDAVVTQVLTDPETGLATGVRYADRKSGAVHEVRARAVVLGASPIETVRLLLHSRSSRHPDGIGNSTGQLGRYFMDQPATLIFARFPGPRFPGDGDFAMDEDLPFDPRYGTTGGLYIAPACPEPGRNDAPLLASTYQGSIGRQPHVRPGPWRDATFMCFSEMLPREDNRITLDPHKRDRWGVPLPVIACRLGAVERSELPRQAEDMAGMIAAAGGHVCGWISPLGIKERGEGLYRDLDPFSRFLVRMMLPHSLAMGAAIHESGGARMGDDPKVSVTDSFNRVWDAPNVIVADASAFVSSGAMGTTLTVMALATRACARLAGDLRSGRMSAVG